MRGVERQFALLKDAIEARDVGLFNTSSLYTGVHDAWVSGVRAREHGTHTGVTLRHWFFARELVTVDPEIRREGDLKKGWPSGHPSPDCFGS